MHEFEAASDSFFKAMCEKYIVWHATEKMRINRCQPNSPSVEKAAS
jgi:hypothetical protein